MINAPTRLNATALKDIAASFRHLDANVVKEVPGLAALTADSQNATSAGKRPHRTDSHPSDSVRARVL
jgi:hypothetical protein